MLQSMGGRDSNTDGQLKKTTKLSTAPAPRQPSDSSFLGKPGCRPSSSEHTSLHLGLPFSPLVFHVAPSSWALPTDLLPAAKASTAQVLPGLSSRELSPSRALGLQVQGRVRTDKSTHHLTTHSPTHPSYHPYIQLSFHPLIFLSIYSFIYLGIQQEHPLW